MGDMNKMPQYALLLAPDNFVSLSFKGCVLFCFVMLCFVMFCFVMFGSCFFFVSSFVLSRASPSCCVLLLRARL
jgi:hypothetical protein